MQAVQKFSVGNLEFGGDRLIIIGGPCLAESDLICLEVGERLLQICQEFGFGYVFKASFDKANRSSLTDRGDGLKVGLERIAHTARLLKVPCTTDLHSPEQASEVAAVVDLLQIPAFLCRQTDLLQAAAETDKPVNVKKGQFLAPWDTKNIVDKLHAFGAKGTMLTERGTSFGYNTLIVDMPGLETMRELGVPVCFDATHSAQRPGGQGTSTGGVRESIPAMARAAVAVGVDALFLECHPDPAKALSDAATQWPLSEAHKLLAQIDKIDKARRSLQ